MLQNSVRLFRIGGIDVGVHYSWLVIFALMTWSFGGAALPRLLPDVGPGERYVLGALAALLLFASVLVHELAHSFMARARGLDARSITLFIFGGVSNLGGEAKKPSTEFLVAIVGPLTSFAVAAVFYGVLVTVDQSRVEAMALLLTGINVALGVFNLVPGFPLDGGRVLRSIVWTVTGSVRRATEIAAGVGKIVAYLLLAYGVFQLLDGAVFNGIWTAAIGWFLHNAADQSVQQLVLETRLRKVRAGDVVRPDAAAVAPGISVAELIDAYLLPGNRRAIPVADNGRLVGMVTLSDVQRVPAEARARTAVAEAMGGREGIVTVRADEPVRRAIDLLAEHEFEQVPVLADGRLVGVLTRADVLRQLQLREALDL